MTHSNDIIIADSDPVMRTIVRMHFSRFGFAVLQATHGQEVIAAADRTTARLVLLDSDLPHLGAYEACVGLRRLNVYRDTPIVLMTAHDSSRTREAARRAGATKVVVKPLSMIDLCRALAPLMAELDDGGQPPWRGLAEASPPLIWPRRSGLDWRGRATASLHEDAHRQPVYSGRDRFSGSPVT